tara:strand:- start:718 stop:1005 length:288 start_codon:yes stop_codon:yes gene_type:complete
MASSSPKKRTTTKKRATVQEAPPTEAPVEIKEESSSEAPVEIKPMPKVEKEPLIPLEIYLLATGVKAHHIPAMQVFAGRRKVATARQWEKLFSNY